MGNRGVPVKAELFPSEGDWKIYPTRCGAPGCGDKIKSGMMYKVTFDDGSTLYIEEGCASWFRDGHPDYGGGFDVDLAKLAEKSKGEP